MFAFQILDWIQWTLWLIAGLLFLQWRNRDDDINRSSALFFGTLALALLFSAGLDAKHEASYVEGTITGQVNGFHEVTGYRSSHFEFQLIGTSGEQNAFSADYFDKGFYFGDSAVQNGDTLSLRFDPTTHVATYIEVVRGKHAGWTHVRERNFTPAFIMGLLGFFALFKAVTEIIVNRQVAIEP